jgi:hypothetical protein
MMRVSPPDELRRATPEDMYFFGLPLDHTAVIHSITIT